MRVFFLTILALLNITAVIKAYQLTALEIAKDEQIFAKKLLQIQKEQLLKSKSTLTRTRRNVANVANVPNIANVPNVIKIIIVQTFGGQAIVNDPKSITHNLLSIVMIHENDNRIAKICDYELLYEGRQSDAATVTKNACKVLPKADEKNGYCVPLEYCRSLSELATNDNFDEYYNNEIANRACPDEYPIKKVSCPLTLTAYRIIHEMPWKTINASKITLNNLLKKNRSKYEVLEILGGAAEIGNPTVNKFVTVALEKTESPNKLLICESSLNTELTRKQNVTDLIKNCQIRQKPEAHCMNWFQCRKILDIYQAEKTGEESVNALRQFKCADEKVWCPIDAAIIAKYPETKTTKLKRSAWSNWQSD